MPHAVHNAPCNEPKNPSSVSAAWFIEAFCEEYRRSEQCDALKHLAALICVEMIDEGLNPAIGTRKEKAGYQKASPRPSNPPRG